MKKGLLLIALLSIPTAAAAQSESFLTRVGADTIAVETFVRSPTRLEAELGGRAFNSRLRYSADLTNGRVAMMRLEIIAAGVDTANARGTIAFRPDSIIAEMTRNGAAMPVQRLASNPDVAPFINLSFALVDVITTRAQRAAGDSAVIPLFILGNGAMLNATMRWLPGDSAVFSAGGVDLFLKLDARGRLLRAAVPSQNLTVDRIAGTLSRAPDAKPDYSAPADAAYTAEDVRVQTSEGHTIAGTLTLPNTRRGGKIAAVITISGSGPQDRDESLAGMTGYRPFRQIAETLAARGVAVLRYDDRGWGESGGVHATATSADFANDTRAMIAYLRARPEIDASRIFLLGHSEGGLIAPMVAAEDANLRGIVLLAGPAYTGRRILEYQAGAAIGQLTGKTAAERDSLLRANMATLDNIGTDQPWMRYFRDYDPVATLRKVKVPVLVIHGATDRQVTAEQAEVIGQTLRGAGNSDVAVHVLPDVNHLFLQDPVGGAAGYSALPSKSLVPTVLQLIGDWIATKAR
jgi:uncharacterized protein